MLQPAVVTSTLRENMTLEALHVGVVFVCCQYRLLDLLAGGSGFSRMAGLSPEDKRRAGRELGRTTWPPQVAKFTRTPTLSINARSCYNLQLKDRPSGKSGLKTQAIRMGGCLSNGS